MGIIIPMMLAVQKSVRSPYDQPIYHRLSYSYFELILKTMAAIFWDDGQTKSWKMAAKQ